jgi:hypothetical protein
MSGAEEFYIYQFAAALSRSNQPRSSLSARPETPDQPAGRPVLQDRGTLLDSPGGVNRFLRGSQGEAIKATRKILFRVERARES